MLTINRGAYIVVMLFTYLNAWSQNPTAAIKKTADYYHSLSAFSVDISVNFYEQEITTKPAKIMKGYTRISGNLSHSNFDGRENIMGTDFILVADYGNKSIYYSPREKTSKHKVSRGTEVLDSVFIKKYNIATYSSDRDIITYKLVPKSNSNEYNSITIKINKSTHVLTEITYIYSGNVKYKKSIIRYSNFNPAWKAGKDEFSEKKFLLNRHKQAILTKSFSEYKLINSYNYDPKKNLIE